ncbi:MAG: hypothetical protein JWM33_1278, partial [Caulobacteraceae bacterium]|nr:hypothetical protein [Caulobacteraceae bacterium]
MVRLWSVLCALVCLGLAAGHAAAQTFDPPPVRRAVDANGVDLFSQKLVYDRGGVGIGPAGAGGMSVHPDIKGRTEYSGLISWNYSWLSVEIGSMADTFYGFVGGVAASRQNSGATLTFAPGGSGTFSGSTAYSGGKYYYTTADGTIYEFLILPTTPYGWYSRLVKISRPDGEVVTITLDRQYRTQSAANNYGYQFQYSWGSYWGDPPAKIIAFNSQVETCGATTDANSCGFSQSWPTWTDSFSSTYDNSTVSGFGASYVTMDEEAGEYSVSSPTLNGSLSWAPDSDTGAFTNPLGTYTYEKSYGGVAITDPQGHHTYYGLDRTNLLVTSFRDAMGRETTYSYDTDHRPYQIIYPDGHKQQYAYDSRGNITSVTQIAASGSGLSNIVTAASYASSCSPSTDRSCNKPLSTTDAAGNVTDYTYDTTTGAVLTVTAPSPDGTAPRPQTRYSYSSQSGTSGSIAKLTAISTCQTGGASSCVGTADETRSTISYGSVSTNNLSPSSVTIAAGDNSLTGTTAYTYNRLGDAETVDGPLSGTGDKSTLYYDLAHRVVGTVDSDPDGSGSGHPLLPRATRLTRDGAGRLTATEVGTVSSVTDNPVFTLTALASESTTYDFAGRVLMTASSAGEIVQNEFDSAGRLICATQRLNAYGSLSACTPATAGSDGPDRITRYSYNAADQLVETRDGCTSTTCLRVVQSLAYDGATGALASVTDGNSHTTSYAYDGFGRQTSITYADSS